MEIEFEEKKEIFETLKRIPVRLIKKVKKDYSNKEATLPTAPYE